MKNIGDKLKELREASNLTRKEVADKLKKLGIDISDKTLYGYESGRNSANADMFLALCQIYKCNNIMEAFSDAVEDVLFTNSEWKVIEKYRFISEHSPTGGETVNYILGREYDIAKQIQAQSEALAAKDTRIIELESTLSKRPSVLHLYTYMNKIACAGVGFYFEDIPSDTIEAPYVEDADFIIGVSGDSMEPDYYDGDKLYVRKTNEIPTGKIGIFLNGNECFIKELGIDGLISHNKKYDNIPASEDIRVIGEVLGKVEGL